NSPVSFQILEELSSYYGVSVETLFVRLRTLRLWSCELSVWHRMTTGTFVLDRIHGWKRVDWNWADSSVPLRAWESRGPNPLRGQTFVYLEDNAGRSGAKRIYYQ